MAEKNRDTGFKDVNKVPIKEGDILKVNERSDLYVVFWEDHSKTFKLFAVTDLYDVLEWGFIHEPYDYFQSYHPMVTLTTATVVARIVEILNRGE